VARVLWFPLLFAYFAVPAGEALVPALMEGTANFTVAALRASAVPVYRDGLNFVIPSGQWSVVEACSGVRYLIASFMVGTLFAYLNFQGTTKRLVFMGVSLLVPIVANWLRAYLIVMLGHLSGNRLAVGADHLLYGWVFFGVVMLVTYLIGARWAEPDPDPKAAAVTSPVANPGSGAGLLLAGLAAALVLAGPVVAEWARQRPHGGSLALELPLQLPGGWSARSLPADAWQPVYQKPSVRSASRYMAKAESVDVDIAYYRQQSRERKLVSTTNVLLPQGDPTWSAQSLGTVQVPVAGRQITWRATRLISRLGDRPDRLVWQTFWVDGQFTASELHARLALAQAIVGGRGDDAAGLVVSTELTDPAAAQHRQSGLVQSALPAWQQVLESARRGAP
jgi:EpsI family protein